MTNEPLKLPPFRTTAWCGRSVVLHQAPRQDSRRPLTRVAKAGAWAWAKAQSALQPLQPKVRDEEKERGLVVSALCPLPFAKKAPRRLRYVRLLLLGCSVDFAGRWCFARVCVLGNHCGVWFLRRSWFWGLVHAAASEEVERYTHENMPHPVRHSHPITLLVETKSEADECNHLDVTGYRSVSPWCGTGARDRAL